MTATHLYTEGKTRRQVVNMALNAMARIEDCDQGTRANPVNLASTVIRDCGKTIIQIIHEDGCIQYNDGWFIVEVDDFCMYVDITGIALKELGNPEYEIIDNVN
jgi:hypothetical protein